MRIKFINSLRNYGILLKQRGTNNGNYENF